MINYKGCHKNSQLIFQTYLTLQIGYINPKYKQLYPDDKEGIVITHLYERVNSLRYKNYSFTTEEIYSLFEEIMNEEEKEFLT